MGVDVVGGTQTRLVTKVNTAGAALSLSGLTGTATNTAAADATYGGYVQVTASTSSDLLIVGVSAKVTSGANSLNSGPLFVDIGIGGAGAETSIGAVAIATTAATYSTSPQVVFESGNVSLPVAIRVGVGQRVAVRTALGTRNGTPGVSVWLLTIPTSNLESN